MCQMGEWAAVMAFASTYNIQDGKMINDVALNIGGRTYPTPAALRTEIIKEFAKHGIRMV